MFTKNQERLLKWAKQMKSLPRTRKLVIDWDWTDTGKKTAYIYQEFVDAGVPRIQRTKLFTSSPEKFDDRYKEAAARIK